MTAGRKGSAYEPWPEIEDRLDAWYWGCKDGLSVAQIAENLGLSVSRLTRSVYRARAHGHPKAIRHPMADSYSQPGLAHTVSPSARASRRRRLAREAAERATLPHDSG